MGGEVEHFMAIPFDVENGRAVKTGAIRNHVTIASDYD
jgi:hypothetical protein